MRTTLAMALALSALLLGCSETEVDTPVACLGSPAAITAALRNAPEPVVLDSDTRISDCLVRNQPEGDLVNFGGTVTVVATDLGGDVATRGPAGVKAAIDVGYLVGAIEKGAENSEGIHATLVERVRSAATNGLSPTSAIKQSHYEAGYEAGKESG